MVKFMYNGIKIDGKLHKASYSKGPFTNMPDGTITIYAKNYTRLPAVDGLTIQNNTDIMTDYFECDKVRVFPTNKHYPAVLAAHEKQMNRRA